MPPLPKRIAIITGGGDCPGLNAAIRAIAKSAMFEHSLEVFGVEDAFQGLIDNRIRPLAREEVSGIITRGGTMLGTSNKANPAQYAVGYDENADPIFEDRTDLCMDHIKQHDIDALIVVGGDGTMTVAEPFAQRGINVMGVPKTIDNDLHGSEVTIGFQTAVEIATDALDRLHTTAMSHHRVMVVEVMGRNAGWIALHAGVASGSDVILLPEIPYDLATICDFVTHRSKIGKRFSLICVAEGAKPAGGVQVVDRIDPTSPDPIRLGGIGEQLADDIERVTSLACRATVLGHVQRGGTPCAEDRVLATQLAHHAVDEMMKGRESRLAVVQNGAVTDIGLVEAANKQRLIDLDNDLLQAARAVGTCFG
ncbi:MAG: 6-phosphofructokinase [Planctomycetota bacterium]|jgi:6-phosphofructokinase 1